MPPLVQITPPAPPPPRLFEYRLNFDAWLPLSDTPDWFGGVRLSPALRTNITDSISVNARVEGTFVNTQNFSMGGPLLDLYTSSTMPDRIPGNWVYTPHGTNDNVRANFGIRTLTVDWKPFKDLLFRAGRDRPDILRLQEVLLSSNYGYSATPNWARLNIPYDWLGVWAVYDRVRPGALLNEVMFGANWMPGLDDSWLASAQTFWRMTLPEGMNLGVGGHVQVRRNQTDLHLQDSGLAHSEAVYAQLSLRDPALMFALAYYQQINDWTSGGGLPAHEYRRMVDFVATYQTADWLFRISAAFMLRGRLAGNRANEVSQTQTDIQVEGSVNRRIVEGIEHTGIFASFGFLTGTMPGLGDPMGASVLFFFAVNSNYRGGFGPRRSLYSLIFE